MATHGARSRKKGRGSSADAAMAQMRPQVTGLQLAAVALLTLLALAAGILLPALKLNLGLGARDVGGLIMPPGMIMDRTTPAAAMREMAAVDLREVRTVAAVEDQGDQTLRPGVVDGVKVFALEASVIEWSILPGVRVAAYAFNGQVPGPRIRVTDGDRVRITVTNRLPEPTSVHWHGLVVPNEMDGAADVTQAPIPPGGVFTYEFMVRQAGTFFYHSHKEPDRQQALGLYGALLIDPRTPAGEPAAQLERVIQLQEWLKRDGLTFPAMSMEGALPNFFTINGKAYPATETIRMKVGQRVRLRFIGSNTIFAHPMHIHGGPFTVVATDGYPVPKAAQIVKDVISVAPGERYDVIWTAREPGRWLLHCHIPHHTTNNNVEVDGGGGLTMIIEVRP